MSTIRVIAAKGRQVPIHPNVASGSGDSILIVDDQKAVDLEDCAYVRRRMRSGDLLEAPAQTGKKES